MRRGLHGAVTAKVRLYLVSRNRKKVEELTRLAGASGIELVPLDVPKVEVQSESLMEVALYSATAAYLSVRKPLIVEDSGLFIKSLNMFPGAMSSYVFKTIGIRGVLKLMEGVGDREAFFESVIALAAPALDGVRVFRGVVRGRIAEEPRGTGGFGFDPIFVPEGYNVTFAEMSMEEKNAVSHRGAAFRALSRWLLENCERVACQSWS